MSLRWIFAIAMLVTLVGTSAQAALEFPQEIAYKSLGLTATSDYNNDFDAIVKKSGYSQLDSEGAETFNNPIAWLNRVYAKKGNGRIFAKGGVFIDGEIEYGRVYRAGIGMYIGHIEDLQHGDHVFFFDGLSEEAAAEFLKKMSKVTERGNAVAGVRKRARYARLMVERAYAQQQEEVATDAPAPTQEGTIPNRFCESAPSKEDPLYKSVPLLNNVAGACGSGIVKGLWAGTGGLVESAFDIGKGVVSFIGDPRNMAQKIKEGWNNLSNFVTNFDSFVGQVIKNAGELDPQDKSEILCELVGTIGVGAVVNTMVSGAGSAALAAQIHRIVDKMASLGKLKTLKSAQAAKQFTKQRADATRAFDVTTGTKNAKVKAAFEKHSAAAAKASATSESALNAERVYATFAAGDKIKKAKEVSDRMKKANMSMNRLSTVGQGARNLEGAAKSLRLPRDLKKEVTATLKDVKKLEKEITKAGKDSPKAKALDERREVLAVRVRQATMKMEALGDALVPPKGGWTVTSPVGPNSGDKLKAAADATKAEAAKAEAARKAAAGLHDDAIKAANAPDIAKERAKSAGVTGFYGALAACNATENIQDKTGSKPNTPNNSAPSAQGQTAQ